jgi:feruloyl esterase
MEAQRFPTDYDGILAGAPAYNWTGLLSAGSVIESQLHSSPAANIPASKLPAIGNAVRAACDTADGVKDGVLNDPRTCHFDPAVLTCKAGDSDSCLTPTQVASLKVVYSPKVDAQGKQMYPGYLPGAEDDGNAWGPWVLGDRSLMLFFSTGFFSDFVYQRPGWQVQSFDINRDYPAALAKTGEALDATNIDLQPFLAHGGRLILYHGFNDPAIPALGTIDYFNRMTGKVGGATAKKGTRLYMVPGMLHCSSGPGATNLGQDEDNAVGTDPQHSLIAALEQWVENGTAPGTLTATKFADDDTTKPVAMTRPVCPYPELPKYVSGDTNDAKSFTCTVPRK